MMAGKDYIPRMFVRSSDGRAAVKLGGKVRYCGKGDTLMSRARYHRLVSEWLEERARAESGSTAETPSPPPAAGEGAPPGAASPADDWAVERTCARLPAELVAMARLQRLTGMRPDEACLIREADLDRSGVPWIYRPGMPRRGIFLGPRAVWLLKRWIERQPDPEGYLLPAGDSGRPHTAWAYLKAVHLACVGLGIPPWHPMQLSHALAAEVLARFGPEASRAVIDPARPDLWPTLAARDIRLARKVAMEIG